MFTYLYRLHKRLALVVILLSTTTLVFGAKEDFDKIAKRSLAETHAKNFQEGDIKGCVSMYAANAKFFVDNKLDGISKIEIDEFVDIGSNENFGWAIFNYTKQYDLKNRDPEFLRSNKLEGFSTLSVKQYGAAIFAKKDGQWKIQTMTVFDPEIWEPKK
jgi:hypothetical protein